MFRIMLKVTIVSLIIGAAAAASEPEPSLKSMNWLIGSWAGQGKRWPIGELWTVKDSLTLDGIGFHLNGADTVITERIQFVQCDSGLYFVADVPENKSKVWFRLTAADTLGHIFENPKHDFPTKVCYRNVGRDSLSAWIEGLSGGKPKRIEYKYKRVK